MNTPDKWIVLKLDDIYKVFASWYGGYTSGDSWRMNSGITMVAEDGDYIDFHGYSGSIYRCHKKGYGLSGFSSSVLESLREKVKQGGKEIIVMEEDTDWLKLLEL